MPPTALAGVLAPAVTPFDAAGEVDEAGVARLVAAHLDAGLDGVLVAGSSGEAALLDDEERVRLVAAARPVVPRDRWLLVGVGSESTRATIRRARAAAAEGADAVLVVAPHYYGRRMSDAALAAHFGAVADASPVPVLLYNIPLYAHLVLSPDLVAGLAAHPNVRGMKDSAGDLAALGGYLRARDASDSPSGFRVLTGHAGTFREALALGVDGGILAASLFAPALARGVYDAARASDEARAGAMQARLGPIAREIVAALGPAGLKGAMTMVGLAAGAPRAPLLALDEAERARVRAVLVETGVLDAAPASVGHGAAAVAPA